jgi:hypothetical protein
VSESKVHEIEEITKEPVSNEAPDASDVPEPRVNLARADRTAGASGRD